MKNRLFFISIALMMLINAQAGEPVKQASESNTAGNVVYLTNETFKKKVFDYEINKQWNYAGSKPAIIDFYADWCAPCRKVSPIIEELAKEYDGKIIVYKVDTDKEQLLSQKLGIQSLPTILLIPARGQPQAIMGALPKDQLKNAIQKILLIE